MRVNESGGARGSIACCAGLGFWYVCSPPFALGKVFSFPFSTLDSFAPELILLTSFFLGFVLVLLFHEHLNPLRENLPVLFMLSGVSGAFYLLELVLPVSTALVPWMVLCEACHGLTASVLLLAWIELLGVFDIREVGRAVALGLAVYAVLGVMLYALNYAVLVVQPVILCLSSMASPVCLWAGWSNMSAPKRPSPSVPSSLPKSCFWVLVAVNTGYGMTFGLMRAAVDETPHGMAVSVAFLVASLGLFALFASRFKGADTADVMRSILLPPVFLCLIAMILAHGNPLLAMFLAAIVLGIQAFYVSVVFADITLRFSSSPLVAGGVCGACFAGGIVIGVFVFDFLVRSGSISISSVDMSFFSAVMLAAMLLIAIVYLPGNRRGVSPWGLSTALVPESFDDRLLRQCAAVAKTNGLTSREEEVLAFLAKGRNQDYIQRTLVISANTAKTHVYHVYKKTGVHSRQELIDLVESQKV